MNFSETDSLFPSEAPVTRSKVTKEAVVEVFTFWVEVMRSSGRGPRPVLSDKRERKIRKAIEIYGPTACKEAISGCSLSEFHMGGNQHGRRYDDIELILRDEAHIERFIGIFHDANTGGGFLD